MEKGVKDSQNERRDGTMLFDKVYTVKREFDQDTFIREVLIKLGSNLKTPIDVVTAEFEEVIVSMKEAVVCTAHVESDYVASIGYDRKEIYWDKEKRRDSNGNYYYVDVQKTRTVTDWHPHTGHIGGDATCAAYNDDNVRFAVNENDELVEILKAVQDDSIVEEGEAYLTPGALESVKRNCKFFVELGIDYPGDHHKFESSVADITLSTITCYLLPFYEVTFIYDGVKYKASGFACGNINITTEVPPNKVNLVEYAESETEKDQKLKNISWISFAGSYVFSWIMFALKVYWFWILTLLLLGASIFLNLKYNQKFRQILKNLKEDNAQIKQEKMIEVLAARGYAPLTTEEKALFSKSTASSTHSDGEDRKGIKAFSILGSIGLLILMISSLSANKKYQFEKLHSPDQFEIEVKNKAQEHKKSTSGYSSGYYYYYIYFEYEITTNKIGVENISFELTVFKDGKELGYITSNNNEINLAKKSTESYTMTFELYDDSYIDEDEEFFFELYNADFSDLSFEYEITKISFDDGESYYKSNY